MKILWENEANDIQMHKMSHPICDSTFEHVKQRVELLQAQKQKRADAKMKAERDRINLFAQNVTTMDKSHPQRRALIKRQRKELRDSFKQTSSSNLIDSEIEVIVAEYIEALRSAHIGACCVCHIVQSFILARFNMCIIRLPTVPNS